MCGFSKKQRKKKHPPSTDYIAAAARLKVHSHSRDICVLERAESLGISLAPCHFNFMIEIDMQTGRNCLNEKKKNILVGFVCIFRNF